MLVITVDEGLAEGNFVPEFVSEWILANAASARIADDQAYDGWAAVLAGIRDVQFAHFPAGLRVFRVRFIADRALANRRYIARQNGSSNQRTNAYKY
jgi:hypothetical protein